MCSVRSGEPTTPSHARAARYFLDFDRTSSCVIHFDLARMPTYEYRCPDGHEFELFQSMSDDPTVPCPKCEKLAQRLLSGGAGLIFKGEGFYITDYRSDAYKKAASSERESTTSQEEKSGSSPKSDTPESTGSKEPKPRTESSATPAASSGSSESAARPSKLDT